MHYVVGFPHVITHPIHTTAATPFSARFSCSVQAYGRLTITWYRNNNSLPNKAYSTQISSVNMTTSVLIIPNVTSEDVGAYYCEARIKMLALQSLTGNLVLAGKLSVVLCMCKLCSTYIYLDPPIPPVVMTDPVVNLTVNNYNLTMKCLPDQDNFNYKWIKKNNMLPPRAQGANTSQLTIVNLKPEDSEDYQCVMSNSTGTISSNFSTVSIRGKNTELM